MAWHYTKSRSGARARARARGMRPVPGVLSGILPGWPMGAKERPAYLGHLLLQWEPSQRWLRVQ